ncbi:MAG: hypothetical protein J6C64_04940 [Lachnospiraceae bacterium]|nr:hypothetical protein [Lachnospiraceae bacterium]
MFCATRRLIYWQQIYEIDKTAEVIREKAGIRLSRTLGIQRMTVSRLTSACGIAKGSNVSP